MTPVHPISIGGLLLLAGCQDRFVSTFCLTQGDNALRVDCLVTLKKPGPAELVYRAADGGPEQTLSSPEPATQHRFVAVRMREETRYDFVVRALDAEREASGQWTTGRLPPEAELVVESSGSTTATEDLLFYPSCRSRFAYVLDADGRVVWYQDLAVGLDGSHISRALFLDDRREISVLLDQSRLRRFSLQGELLFEVDTRAIGLERALHHDLFRKDDLLYVLHAWPYEIEGQKYVLDGLYLLDAQDGSHVATWELGSVVVPDGPRGQQGGANAGYWGLRFPDADDWSHGNGLFVDDALGVWTTWYQLDAVTRIDGDPASPTFGALQLALAGSPDSPWSEGGLQVTDPQGLTDDDTFSHPHHPLLLGEGGGTTQRLSLFDNGDGDGSRALALTLGSEAAEIEESLPIGSDCPIEGSVYPLSNGNWLATCATDRRALEIDALTREIVRSVVVSCPARPGGFVPRTIPLAW